jgi:hypothetical protein
MSCSGRRGSIQLRRFLLGHVVADRAIYCVSGWRTLRPPSAPASMLAESRSPSPGYGLAPNDAPQPGLPAGVPDSRGAFGSDWRGFEALVISRW